MFRRTKYTLMNEQDSLLKRSFSLNEAELLRFKETLFLVSLPNHVSSPIVSESFGNGVYTFESKSSAYNINRYPPIRNVTSYSHIENLKSQVS